MAVPTVTPHELRSEQGVSEGCPSRSSEGDEQSKGEQHDDDREEPPFFVVGESVFGCGALNPQAPPLRRTRRKPSEASFTSGYPVPFGPVIFSVDGTRALTEKGYPWRDPDLRWANHDPHGAAVPDTADLADRAGDHHEMCPVRQAV